MLSLADGYVAPNGLETLGELLQKADFEIRYPDIIWCTALAVPGSGMENSGCSETMGDTGGGIRLIHGLLLRS